MSYGDDYGWTADDLPGDEPTGETAYPFILIEGEEKAGKTSAALMLTRSERIGYSWIIELGEAKADEYKSLGRHRMLRHNGTYWDMMKKLELAIAVPQKDGKPNVIIFDTGTALWEMEKMRVDQRARRGAQAKAKRENRTFYEDDEIKAPFNLWSDAKVRWYRVINLLRRWDGIAIMIARGKDGVKIDGGKPVENETEWKVQTEGNLKFEVDAWVRMMRPHTATLMGAGSWNVQVPEKGIPLPDQGPLEHLIFEMLGAGTDTFVSRNSSVATQVGIDVVTAKNGLVARFARACDEDRAIDEAGAIWKKAGHSKLPKDAEISDEQWAQLMTMVADRITEITQEKPSGPPDGGVKAPAPLPAPSVDQEPAAAPPTPLESPAAEPVAVPVQQPAARAEPETSRRAEPETSSEMPKFVNIGNRVGRLEGHVQVEFMKWLKSEFNCGPMAVPESHLALITAELDRIDPPPPPFSDKDCTLPPRGAKVSAMDPNRKASTAEKEELTKVLRRRGLTGPDRYKAVGRIIGRGIRSLDGLKSGEVTKCVDTLESLDGSIEAAALFADSAAS